MHVDDEEFIAHPGDVLLIRGGVLHGGTPSDCVYECFTFDLYGLFRTMDMVKHSLRPFYRQTVIPQCFFPAGLNADIQQCTAMLMDTLRSPGEPDCRELVTVGAVSNLFAAIIHHGSFRSQTEKSISGNRRIGQIKSVLEHIEFNFGSNLTLDSLAAVAGMNPKYFCRVFQNLTHQSPMEYVNFFRIEQAAYMLGNMDASITAIGLECGFGESSYFTKVFKKFKGITPKEYRNSIFSF